MPSTWKAVYALSQEVIQEDGAGAGCERVCGVCFCVVGRGPVQSPGAIQFRPYLGAWSIQRPCKTVDNAQVSPEPGRLCMCPGTNAQPHIADQQMLLHLHFSFRLQFICNGHRKLVRIHEQPLSFSHDSERHSWQVCSCCLQLSTQCSMTGYSYSNWCIYHQASSNASTVTSKCRCHVQQSCACRTQIIGLCTTRSPQGHCTMVTVGNAAGCTHLFVFHGLGGRNNVQTVCCSVYVPTIIKQCPSSCCLLVKHGTSALGIQGGNDEIKAPTVRLIKLLLVVYVYDAEDDTFKQLPSMPAHMPLQIHNATKALQSIDEGMTQHGLGQSSCC